MPLSQLVPFNPTPLVHALLGAPPLAGQAAAPGGAPGAAGGAAARPPGGLGDPTFIYLTILLLVGMVAFTLFGQRKERKRRESLLGAIKKHDRVQTIGGIIGSVVEVKPDVVVLKVDESSNTRMTFAKSAVQQILKEAPAPSGETS